MSVATATQKKNMKENLLSFLFSLLVHALLFLLFGMTFLHFHHVTSPPEPIAEETPPEVIFDLTPPPPPPKRETVSTAAEHPLEKAPDHAAFESHENTEAASELSPTGTAALPTQQGREQDTISLREADHSVGEKEMSSPAAVVAAPAPPTLNKTAEALPAPLEKTTAIAEAQPVATPNPEQPVMGKLSSSAKNAQETERSSIIRGNISNKGKSSVSAEATPIGRYKKTLSDAISSRWRYYIDNRMELLSFGTATIAFYVTQEGKIEDIHLLSNSSNQTFADCCIKSIMEAKLPAIPPEVAATLQDKKLEVEYRFTICSDTDF